MLKSNSVFNSWESVVESSHKILSIIDCPGFDTYTSSTLQSLLSYNPDYCILVVSPLKAVAEIQEQIRLAIAMNTSFAVAITHTDEASPKTLSVVLKAVPSPDPRRLL